MLCRSSNFLPQYFPFNGARIYLDGRFMRAENYTFDHQYLQLEDKHVCKNRTRKSNGLKRSRIMKTDEPRCSSKRLLMHQTIMAMHTLKWQCPRQQTRQFMFVIYLIPDEEIVGDKDLGGSSIRYLGLTFQGNS